MRLVIHALIAVACSTGPAVPAQADEAPAGALPRVLIIGDSISIGYMEPLKKLLEGKAEVVHNEGNARHSGYGLENLDNWLGDGHWDVIHFNFGLHDLKYVDDKGQNAPTTEQGRIQVPVERYRTNLEAIVKRLKQTKAHLIFATTTPFPKELTNAIRKTEDLPRYNEAALAVMKDNEIPVNDLASFVAPRMAELQAPKDVHFTKKGSEALAGEVAKAIEAALSKRAP